MTVEEFETHRARLESIAERLDRLVGEARAERDALSPSADPQLEAGMSRLAREVGEAAHVARTLVIATGSAGG